MNDRVESDNLYGIDLNHGRYKVIEKEVKLSPNTFVIDNNKGSLDNDNLIAVIAIFIVISILAGFICFLCGSGVGGYFGFEKGKKSQMRKDQNKDKYHKIMMNDPDQNDGV